MNGVLFEMLSRSMTFFNLKNLPFFHIYTVIEFALISWFYQAYFSNTLKKSFFLAIFIFFFAFSLIDSLVLHNVMTFNSYAKSLECFLVVGYTILYLFKTFDNFQEKDPSDTPAFWINAGFLFYFSGCLFLFTFSNFILTQEKSIMLITWALHAFFMILMYVLIAIGLLHTTRK
jgi:hypothetical protein